MEMDGPKTLLYTQEIITDRLRNITLEDRLICPICNKIYRNPQECQGCGMIYCEPCLKISLEKNKICPTCQKETKFESSKFMLRRLDDLPPIIMKCKHVVSLKNRTEHKKNCPDYLVKCEGCSVLLKRYDLLKHKCLAFLFQEIELLKEENKMMKEEIELLKHSRKCEYQDCVVDVEIDCEESIVKYKCKKCKKLVCKRYIRVTEKGNYCSYCLENKLTLTTVSATSTTQQEGVSLENILEENTEQWVSRQHTKEERKTADESVIVKIRDDKQAIISRLYILWEVV